MDKTILFLAFLQKDKAGGRKNGQKNDNLAKRLKTEACAFLTKIGVAEVYLISGGLVMKAKAGD